MATLRSLGISKSAGLSYLISEGLTQPHSADCAGTCYGEPGDELVVVDFRVVWTRYGVLQQVYDLGIEQEKITQALFATFPLDSVESQSLSQDDSGNASTDLARSRAVVILLKTQLHVYFIGGTSHIVSLPFEVQQAFSTPYGMVLQRVQVARPITISFQATKTPANSFAISQPDLLASPESWKKKTPNESDPFHAAFFKNRVTSVTPPAPKDLPQHVHLRDPLTEVGLIGEVTENQSAPGRRKSFTGFSQLPRDEEIVHVSARSELPSKELLLVVTRNHSTFRYTIWKLVETPQRVSLRRRTRAERYLESQRRSSHALGTGASTPGLRSSINPRESFGGFNEPLQTINSRKPKSDAELANQLDAAFEGPTTASQSSRRISSLLARSDLATGNDAVGITDPMAHAGRRGPSFGGPGARTSFGGAAASFTRRSGRFYRFEKELEDVPSGDVSDDTMETDSDGGDTTQAPGTSRSLQRDLVLVKVRELEVPTGNTQLNNTFTSRPTTIISRARSLHSTKYETLLVYVHDTNSGKVLCANLNALESYKSTVASQTDLQVHFKSMEIINDVAGICKVDTISENNCIMLRQGPDGKPVLIKHTPTKSALLQLPKTFLRRNPFQTGVQESLQKRREGGLKRVLSDGVDRVRNIRASSIPYQFDIEDSKGIWHRLELQQGPSTRFMTTILGVCETVLSPQASEHRSVYHLWDEIRLWLSANDPECENPEWKTFVILIFSLYALYLPEKTAVAKLKPRKKTGLLRSSSGANIDTESFDTMMLMEDETGMFSPPWLQYTSWQWTLDSTISAHAGKAAAAGMLKKVNIMPDLLQQARNFINTTSGEAAFGSKGYFPTKKTNAEASHSVLTWLLAALHLIREEEKLNILNADNVRALTPILAQIGGWLGCPDWDWREPAYYSTESIELDRHTFDESVIEPLLTSRPQIPPPSIFAYVEEVLLDTTSKRFPSLADLPIFGQSDAGMAAMERLTPRTAMVLRILDMRKLNMRQTLLAIAKHDWHYGILESLPEGIVVALRAVLVAAQAHPPVGIPNPLLGLIDREDLNMLENHDETGKPQARSIEHTKHESSRDYHDTASSALPKHEESGPYDEAAEADRQAITRLIFSNDRRFMEAARLLHPLKPSTVQCLPEPEWTDQELLEAQQELAKVVAYRTLAVSPGRAMLYYNARHPLLTEKFPIHGFTLSALMKPSNITVAADKTSYSEDRVSWAFFHAGVEAGLTISKDAQGIDTSWLLFNKPKELNHRHAGFLLALGLNGHLKTIAKWVAFKYLTPKDTMTSIGLLLGLAASHIGSMDPLVTRLLSVHVSRMLPPNAADLNISPLTQTSGIMGLGLLYYNTQHRRMTELMLSELECAVRIDPVGAMDQVINEGHRLATGFALGYINLGHGRKTKGLVDMRIVERLLALVVTTRQVTMVHLLDKATAGATIALALIFMKTEDQALANKIDIPETVHQFEYVRPDIFLLRTVARHLIMWNKIEPTAQWIKESTPQAYQKRAKLQQIRSLHSEDLPLYNIVAGLCLAIGLRFAGSARLDVRELLTTYLDEFIRINKLPALHYDGLLTRVTTRNCQDVVALSAAAVMAGTGDLQLFRRFRSLHGRTGADIPYGSHLAAHQAIGLLFLGGGTHTLGTSNLAVASLLCSFYPLFPADTQDNKAHLQTFRHLWVFAAEARCLLIRDVESFKPMPLNVKIVLKSGATIEKEAPCHLPELDLISKIVSDDKQYWEVILDFEKNPNHVIAFRQHQSIFVRQRGPHASNSSVFASTIHTLTQRSISHGIHGHVSEWVCGLQNLGFLSQAERVLVLPSGVRNLSSNVGRMTAVDDRLALEKECLTSPMTARLWNLRLLFAWAEHTSQHGDHMAWLGRDIVGSLRAKVALTAAS